MSGTNIKMSKMGKQLRNMTGRKWGSNTHKIWNIIHFFNERLTMVWARNQVEIQSVKSIKWDDRKKSKYMKSQQI